MSSSSSHAGSGDLGSTVLGQLPLGARLAVLRLRSLGDSVLTTPAVHLLKKSRPDLQIAVVSETRFASAWRGNPDVDVVLPPSVREIRSFRPDLCLNLHGGTRSAWLTAFSGAKHRAGFEHFRFRPIYNLHIPKAQTILNVGRKVHTAEHAASAMFFLGVAPEEVPRACLFPTVSAPSLPNPGPYAVIHPVASETAKTWPSPFFLEAAQYIQRELGLHPVFIAGPGEDISLFQRWPTISGASLESIKALLAEASLFLGNDSGPAHMAAAMNIPVLVIFGPSDPVIWAPWKTESEMLVSDGRIENVTPEMVIRALSRMRVHA